MHCHQKSLYILVFSEAVKYPAQVDEQLLYFSAYVKSRYGFGLSSWMSNSKKFPSRMLFSVEWEYLTESG